MTQARLYGRLLTQSSLSVVTEGFRSALESAGMLAGVYGVDTRHLDPDDAPVAGVDATHGIYTGPLERLDEMFEMGRHKYYWVMVAPNSNLLPQKLIDRLIHYRDKCDLRLLAPSRWARDIVAKQVTQTLVMAAPHGVAPGYALHPELSVTRREGYEIGEFRVLHFSTSAQARKGTVELIQAWTKMGSDGHRCQLMCIMDYPAKVALFERLASAGIYSLDASINIKDRGDLPPENLSRVLASAHVVCQPSRGEAFGLIPLEALCCGVPVVATRVTGHTEYLKPGLAGFQEIQVPREDYPRGDPGLEPLDDLPGSVGPILIPDEIGKALQEARSDFIDLQEEAIVAAPRMQWEWSWNNQLKPFINELGKLS